jgi:hypothetical protein
MKQHGKLLITRIPAIRNKLIGEKGLISIKIISNTL